MPNPFHGYCTSALCTPSHWPRELKLKEGDWLIGISPIEDGNKLVYAMRISDVLPLNRYFHDPRFERKKPKPDGTLCEQCGDNIYYKSGDGKWKRLPSRFHNDNDNFRQDVGTKLEGEGNPVFVAEHFYYFGHKRVPIPGELTGVIRHTQGVQYATGHLADDFVMWLETNYKPGILAMPRDMPDHSGETGPMLTEHPDQIAGITPQMENENHPPHGGGCR